MAIINGLGPRTLRLEQHGQTFRIIDQNNMVYCETDNEQVAQEIVNNRNNGQQRRKEYLLVEKTQYAVIEVESTSQWETIAKGQWEAKRLINNKKIQWKDLDSPEYRYRLVQEDEYERYCRWRDGWKP